MNESLEPTYTMTRSRLFERPLSLCLIFLLALPVGASASSIEEHLPQASTTNQQGGQNTNTQPSEAGTPPPAPDASQAQDAPQTQEQRAPVQTAPTPQPQKPLGTAAAPDTSGDGVPASTPAGAAIAPAKQKRVRKFAIRTAILIGAVVAVGTVVGLSMTSSGHQ